jgi:hypothetical protein
MMVEQTCRMRTSSNFRLYANSLSRKLVFVNALCICVRAERYLKSIYESRIIYDVRPFMVRNFLIKSPAKFSSLRGVNRCFIFWAISFPYVLATAHLCSKSVPEVKSTTRLAYTNQRCYEHRKISMG